MLDIMAANEIDLAGATRADIDLTEAEAIRLPEAGTDTGGDVSRKPDEIVAEIEATRAELADTIDAIADKINPRRAAARAKSQVTGAVSSAAHSVAETAETAEAAVVPAVRAPFSDPKVLAAAAAIGALIALLVFRRRH